MKSTSFILTISRIVRDVESDVGMHELTPRAKLLLRLVGEANAFGAAPRISDLARQFDLGTLPTVYAGLASLEAGGWLERRTDDTDTRAKRLYLTKRAQKAFARMSRLIVTEG